MGLHIEISGEASRDEWRAVASVAAIMLRETAIASGTVPTPPAKLGIDADRPPVEPQYQADGEDYEPGASELGAGVPPPPTEQLPSETLITTVAAHVAAAIVAGADLDAAGLPHDLRIHASTRTKKADGTWTSKRGVASTSEGKALVAQVEAELRAIMAANGVPPPPVVTDPAAAFGAPPPPASDGVPPPPVTEAAPPPVTPEPPAQELPFARVMRVVVAKQAAKTLTTEMTTQLCQSLGLTSIRDLAARPDLIPQFEALLP